jgi:IclR family acetate operon transcriptional repressor
MREKPMSEQELVKTAARTLDLFEVFAAARGPLSLTDLAQRIGSPISSCHALIRTLQTRGYVYVLDARKRVYPTKRLLAVAEAIAQHDPVLERLSPILETLLKTTGETVILGKRQGDRVTYLDVLEGNHTLRYAASPGDTKPLHSSAIGKAMLGALQQSELDKLLSRIELPRITDRTITNRVALVEDLEASRQRGYFVTSGENVADVMAVSIMRRVAEEPYGIAIAGPVSRIEIRLESILATLRAAGDAVDRMTFVERGAA